MFPSNDRGSSLTKRAFAQVPHPAFVADRMNVEGVVNKSFLLLAVLMVAAFVPWASSSTGDLGTASLCAIGGAVGGFILAMVMSFKVHLAQYLAIPYAILEGFALGGISSLLEHKYPGIAIQAVALTFGVLGAMLVAFRTGLLRATAKFRSVVIGATGAILLLYVATMVLGLFHINLGLMTSHSPLAIGLSLIITVVAALNLILNFDQIQQGVAQGAPKYMEWFSAFSLLVTVAWLYVEILRLLGNARRN